MTAKTCDCRSGTPLPDPFEYPAFGYPLYPYPAYGHPFFPYGYLGFGYPGFGYGGPFGARGHYTVNAG